MHVSLEKTAQFYFKAKKLSHLSQMISVWSERFIWRIIEVMGENIPAILRGEIDPLSLLLKYDLLKEYYSFQDSAIRSYQHACQYADLIAHQNPALKVLEIGAGTG